jgi:hypothetical protein
VTTSSGAPRSPQVHALLLERLARASAAESSQARAQEWAAATDAERVAAFVELSRICVEVARMRGGADAKAPLPKIRITSR